MTAVMAPRSAGPIDDRPPLRPRKSSARSLPLLSAAAGGAGGASTAPRPAVHRYATSTETTPQLSIRTQDPSNRRAGVHIFAGSPPVSPTAPLESPDSDTPKRSSRAGSQELSSSVTSASRSARISGIPVQYREKRGSTGSFKALRRISKSGNDLAGSMKIQMVPTAEAVEVMMQDGRERVPTNAAEEEGTSSTFQGRPSYIKVNRRSTESILKQEQAAADANLPTTPPLQIRRKKTPPQLREGGAQEARPTTPSERRSSSLKQHKSAEGLHLNHLRASGAFSSPPSTPPAFGHSHYSESVTDVDSLRSSMLHTSWPPAPVARKLNFDGSPLVEMEDAEDVVRLSQSKDLQQSRQAGSESTAPTLLPPSDSLTVLACPIQREPDLPGMLRRPTSRSRQGESSSSEDDDDDEEDDDDLHNFSLEDFPVPSSVINTPVPPSGSTMQPPPIQRQSTTASSGVAVDSMTTVRSHIRPDLFQVDTHNHDATHWDLNEELEIRDRVFRAELKAMNKADKQRRKELRRHFDPVKKPSPKDMYEASLLSVRDEFGNRIRFGSLFEGQRTVVCFIRNFWCSLCQDYVDSIAKVKPAVLEKYGMKLVIISCGSWKMIQAYKRLIGEDCPYSIYSDRSKHVYTALGMTLRTFNPGPAADKGAYIKHSMTGNIVQGFVSGMALPLKAPGDQMQIGGEFVLGPGLEVKFCHRMKSTRDHALIEDVLASVDIDVAKETEALQPTPMIATPRMGAFSSAGTSTRTLSRVASAATTTGNGASAPNTASTTHTARFPASVSDANKRSPSMSTKKSPLLGWAKRLTPASPKMHSSKSRSSMPPKDLGISSASLAAMAGQAAPPATSAGAAQTGPSGERKLQKRRSDTAVKRRSSRVAVPPTTDVPGAALSVPEDDKAARRASLPHLIETPPPSSPLSIGFLGSASPAASSTAAPAAAPTPSPLSLQSPPSASSRTTSPVPSLILPQEEHAEPSHVQQLLAPLASPTSADLETSSSRFSSSSEESNAGLKVVGSLARNIRMHLKVRSTTDDAASINSRGSLRPVSR